MASRSNKFTIHVKPARHSQTMSIRGTGRAGKTSYSIPPTYATAQALTVGTDEKAYWSAILTLAQAMVLSL
jgi:hypothetical protein